MKYEVDFGEYRKVVAETTLRHLFESTINHGFDGWNTYADWLVDMKHNHLIKEVA